MIGVFLVHAGFVHVVRDLAAKKLSRLFSSQAGFFTSLHLQNYSMSLCSLCELVINSFSTSEIMQQPSSSDIPVLYLSLF